jgi:hypothetical protein
MEEPAGLSLTGHEMAKPDAAGCRREKLAFKDSLDNVIRI